MKTTVICAVWSGDPKKEELLKKHFYNVFNQTSKVEIVYVFDNADKPFPWAINCADFKTVTSKDDLTIYEAWNVALSLVRTPYVMNLNLDDRLAPDAIETLERELEAQDVALIGGDWKVCYSQEETDDVKPCYPISELPFIQTGWPPPKGTQTRLGSGTGNRGTFGPATMWRMDNHIQVPRYPYRFVDGTKISVLGDAIWWNLITGHLRRKAYKMPTIIGNYHSHPLTQAEFRAHKDDDKILTTAVSFI
jgi:hypothetical protein